MNPLPPAPSPRGDRTPFFTIALSCCNVAPYLGECLDSIVSQPFGDWECVVWCEESDDGTLAIVRERAARDPRFRVFAGPRTGSVSVSRNKGIELARGEYILFADGDDFLSTDALIALHDGIAAHPGADIYAGGGRKFLHPSGETVRILDNYPQSLVREMTGAEATVLQSDTWPVPMLQLAVFRLAFLRKHGLACIPGLLGQDSEFFPRALFLAQRVVPLHVRHYQYRVRDDSAQTARKSRFDLFYDHYAVIYRSLLAFFDAVSKEDGFDLRVAESWARAWISRQIAFEWFSPTVLDSVPRVRRADTLRALFAGGFGAFDRLRRAGGAKTSLLGWWMELFVRHPALRGCAEGFFRAYNALSRLKDRLRSSVPQASRKVWISTVGERPLGPHPTILNPDHPFREAVRYCLAAVLFRLPSRFCAAIIYRLPWRTRVAIAFRRRFGRPISFSSPTTFNEKLNVLKISPDAERLSPYADKLAVRSYVSSVLGPDALVPLLGFWRVPEEIDFASLPGAFVFKCNHGSGQNLLVRDKSALDLPAVRRRLRSWIRQNHSIHFCERIYRPIPPRILAEALLCNPSDAVPTDYKIHCFRGHAVFVQVDIDRETRHRRNFYSPSWKPLPFVWSGPLPDGSPAWPSGHPVPRPPQLPALLRAARLLSAPFPYVRVDLYAFPDRIFFGELTFFHGAGLEPFWPASLDSRLSRLLPFPPPPPGLPSGRKRERANPPPLERNSGRS